MYNKPAWLHGVLFYAQKWQHVNIMQRIKFSDITIAKHGLLTPELRQELNKSMISKTTHRKMLTTPAAIMLMQTR